MTAELPPLRMVALADDVLRGDPSNPRVNQHAIAPIAENITRFGFTAPVVARPDPDRPARPPGTDGPDDPGVPGGLIVIAGHTRLAAAAAVGIEEVPVHVLDVTEAEGRALMLSDNRLGELADWDEAGLATVLAELDAEGIELDGLGWTDDELDALIGDPGPGGGGGGGGGGNDAAPPVPADPVSEVGVVYQLGPHRVMCGDSTNPDHVAVLMFGAVAALAHWDPPYGKGKENEGVANDNLYRGKLDAFLLQTWQTWRPHLADNASLYAWGEAPDLWRWWYTSLLPWETEAGGGLALRNEIVWDKKAAGAGGISHMGAEGLRQYPNGSERCLFAMRGAQEYGNANAEDYWEGWEPIRSYLKGEADKMGWGPQDIRRICGVGMYSHWFSKSQWTMIPEHHYRALQTAADGAAFTRPYTDTKADHTAAQLSGEHLAPRREWAAGRAYFDNTHDNMRDVWEFPRVLGDERHGHTTPKPVAMMERIARSSAPEGGLVVEPFGGSGSTLIGCAAAGRVCYTMELLPEWVDVIRQRWTAFAIANDIDPGPGALGGDLPPEAGT